MHAPRHQPCVQEDLDELIKTRNLSIIRFNILRNLIIYLKMLFQIKFIEKCAWKVLWTESRGSAPEPNNQILDNESEVRNFRNTKSFYSNYYQH